MTRAAPSQTGCPHHDARSACSRATRTADHACGTSNLVCLQCDLGVVAMLREMPEQALRNEGAAS